MHLQKAKHLKKASKDVTSRDEFVKNASSDVAARNAYKFVSVRIASKDVSVRNASTDGFKKFNKRYV